MFFLRRGKKKNLAWFAVLSFPCVLFLPSGLKKMHCYNLGAERASPDLDDCLHEEQSKTPGRLTSVCT